MKINLKPFLDKLSITNLILLSGSIFMIGPFTILSTFTFLVIILSLSIKKTSKKKDLQSLIYYILITAFFLFLNYFFSISKDISDYVRFFIRLIIGGLIYFSLNNRELFLFYLFKILRLILVLSLVGFVLSQFTDGFKVDISDSYRVSTLWYFHYMGSSVSILGYNITRNQGIFWEPGILSIYLNIFLYLALFPVIKKNYAVLASLAIITTFSTTGLFLLCVQWILYLKKSSNFKFNIKTAIISTFSILLIGFIALSSLKDKQKESEDTVISSYSLRLLDLSLGIKLALDNPFVGIGLNKKAYDFERNKLMPKEFLEFYSIMEERGSSNSLLALFFMFGIPIAIFVIYMFYKQNIFIHFKLMFVMYILIFISTEPLIFTPFFILIFYSGFSQILNKIKIIKST